MRTAYNNPAMNAHMSTPNHEKPTQDRLVVFSDDWGRHPSSCQHLTGRLLNRYSVLWVNTIGTRPPRVCLEDIGKITVKLDQWIGSAAPTRSQPNNLTILNPLMYPGFRRHWQRRLNSSLVTKSVNRALGPRTSGQQRVAVTTIPVIADMVNRLDVDRWVYYCVDDFSAWPGLDGAVIDAMERKLLENVDRIVTVSQYLQHRVETMGHESVLLSHGVDLAHWGFHAPEGVDSKEYQSAAPRKREDQTLPKWWASVQRPVLLFWGVIDQRLDTSCCLALAQRCGTLILLGPQQSPDPQLAADRRIHMPGPVPFADLPAMATAADVLVMPYADLPVTRAMQPLKLKEYLATGKPTVVRKLPATVAWSQAADVVSTIEQFVQAVKQRAESGTPADQYQARRRLNEESWDAKATQFEQVLFGSDTDPKRVHATAYR